MRISNRIEKTWTIYIYIYIYREREREITIKGESSKKLNDNFSTIGFVMNFAKNQNWVLKFSLEDLILEFDKFNLEIILY